MGQENQLLARLHWPQFVNEDPRVIEIVIVRADSGQERSRRLQRG